MTRELFCSRYEYMAELLYRRKLPHWRQNQVTYFVTWRLAREQRELDSNERDLVMTAVRKFDGGRYELAAYVVMDDHVHVLLAPLAPHELHGILHSWKSFTARQMQHERKRFGRVWQDEYFDRIMRDDQEVCAKGRVYRRKFTETVAGGSRVPVGMAARAMRISTNGGARKETRAPSTGTDACPTIFQSTHRNRPLLRALYQHPEVGRGQ